MVGLGTLINAAAILAGGIIGLWGGTFMKERHQNAMQTACGISIMFIGAAGAMGKMLTVHDDVITSGQSMLITVCLVLGAFIGEIINIEAAFEHFGEWLKEKTNNTSDASFVNAFVSASLTVSIGAMAIVGSLQDGIFGDWSVLATKGVLDLIIILVMTCSMGKGCIFSAIPVFFFEGLMTLLAVFIKPYMTELALNYIALVGSILIFCVGLNLIWEKKMRVANMLPALLLAYLAAVLPLGAIL